MTVPITLVLLFSVASLIEAQKGSYHKIADKVYCEGKEVYKDYVSLERCADVCTGISQMFIWGTNDFGNNRCKSGKCRCYCQYSTKDYKCIKRKAHTGYKLYAYYKPPASYHKVEDKVYCVGKEAYKDYLSLYGCASVCSRISQMFIWGTNDFGNPRCKDGKCRCYCQHSTTDYKCNKRKAHTGYKLFAYYRPPVPNYLKIGDGVRCENSRSLYTYTGKSSCDGWSGVSLDECQAKCTRNELPNPSCPRHDIKCAYVHYYPPTKWCHLGDNTCKPSLKGSAGNTLYKMHAPFYKIAEKVYCAGKEKYKGYTTLSSCAAVCEGISEMFIFGTNKHGKPRCKNGKCACYCEYTTTDHKCNKRAVHNGYILYSYRDQDVQLGQLKVCNKESVEKIATCASLPKTVCEVQGTLEKIHCEGNRDGQYMCRGVSEEVDFKCCNYDCTT